MFGQHIEITNKTIQNYKLCKFIKLKNITNIIFDLA